MNNMCLHKLWFVPLKQGELSMPKILEQSIGQCQKTMWSLSAPTTFLHNLTCISNHALYKCIMFSFQ